MRTLMNEVHSRLEINIFVTIYGDEIKSAI